MKRLLALTVAALAACETAPAKNDQADGTASVATWKGGNISAGELDAQIFEQRRAALEQMLVRKLVEQKAKAENLAPEQLWKREVTDKAAKPTDSEMKEFYDERSKQRQLPPFETVKEQISRYLRQQALEPVQRAFVQNLKKEYGAEVMLRPQRVEVAAEGPSKGPASAPVTIVEFSDYECPFCSRGEETVARVMKEYDGKVRLVFRDFPLAFDRHARKAAEAAHCAGDQGRYWDMHAKMFANPKALEPTALKRYAQDLGLDQGRFIACLDSDAKAKTVEEHRAAGEKAGVTGAPTFIVNGYVLVGAQPFEEFKTLIDGELAKK